MTDKTQQDDSFYDEATDEVVFILDDEQSDWFSDYLDKKEKEG